VPNGFKLPPFMIVERGCSLSDRQAASPLAFAAAVHMMYEIARLLQFVHGAGRVHRDVCPDNVLLMVQSQAWRLSDFGVSTPLGALLRAHGFRAHTA
jgi:serine/threonine protein kinase